MVKLAHQANVHLMKPGALVHPLILWVGVKFHLVLKLAVVARSVQTAIRIIAHLLIPVFLLVRPAALLDHSQRHPQVHACQICGGVMAYENASALMMPVLFHPHQHQMALSVQ